MKIEKFLKYQIYYFSFIVCILSFIFKAKIKPLIILTFIGGFIIFNIYPGYYKLFNGIVSKNKLILYDAIVHWLPFLLLLFYYKSEPTNWNLVIIISIIYLFYAHNKLKQIYLDPVGYYKN
jgi:hypothetical protein